MSRCCARCNNPAEVKILTPEKEDIHQCRFQQYLDICKNCKQEGDEEVS